MSVAGSARFGHKCGVHLFCLQLDTVWENKPASFQRVRTLIDRCPPSPGSLLVLPEMFATGFSMNVPAIAESAGSETEQFLATLAREFSSTVIGGLPAIFPDGRARNQALVVEPSGTTVTRYAKIYPFSLGGELEHYSAGEEILTFQCQDWIVAPFICYDLRFPEIFRIAAGRGAELFVVIANWPVKRAHHWVTLLQARAIENQAYVVGVNRCGTDPQFVYPGRSLVVDPHGIIVADASDREGVLRVEIDREQVTSWRRDFPALRDMRTEFLRAGW